MAPLKDTKVKVEIVTVEQDQEKDVDRIEYFDFLEEAQLFCMEYNQVNDTIYIPEYRLYAKIQE